MTVTVPVRGLTPWTFLRGAAGSARGFWARDERWIAHAGVAFDLQAEGADRFRRIRASIEALPHPSEDVRVRVYGGFAFRDDHAAGGAWSGFPSARFHLPEVEVTGDASGRGRLRLQRLADPTEVEATERELRAASEDLRERLERRPPEVAVPPAVSARADASGRRAWGDAIEAILAAIRGGRVRKAVLARTLDVHLGGRIDPVDLAETLWRRNPGTHLFLFEPSPGRALVGAAPEALATVRAGIFHATAVAGSVGVGESDDERARMGESLLSSAKDRAEHRMVVDDMVARLGPVATGIRAADEPELLPLARIQHLETAIRARVAPERHVLDLVAALHPTPAVCGVPRDEALALLHDEEPFERGWYAGPVGWCSVDGDGHFVPALRTAVGDGREWRLFAGAGIVEGSTAQGEWDETGIKFQPVLRALEARGVDPITPGTP
ncbi:isochorismate synthase [Gaopeijia maritima]|uniref:isochorismate synthase n=1 Tax=Gaopeijia maritima TaxID=3119007 RepID=UPI0032507D4A